MQLQSDGNADSPPSCDDGETEHEQTSDVMMSDGDKEMGSDSLMSDADDDPDFRGEPQELSECLGELL